MARGNRAVVATTLSWQLWQPHRDLVRALSRHYDLLLVANSGPELARLGSETAARTRALPMSKQIAPLQDAVGLLRWIALLLRERPRLVFAASPKGSLLAMAAARLTGVPRRIYFLGGLRLESESGRLRALLVGMERLTAWCATTVVVNSPSQLDRALDLGLFPAAKAAATVPASSHGVDSEHFDPEQPGRQVPALQELRPGVPVVGIVGRITRDKGFDLLLDSLDRLTREGVPLQLLVVGEHDEPDSAAYLARLRAVSYPVVVTGAVPDVRECYRAMAVHALASVREGFPNVALEAAAMRVPTVTTASTGCVDSVRDGVTGFVVSPARPDEFADAIRALLHDPARGAAMGAAGRAWVVESFQPEDVVASITVHCGLPRAGTIELGEGRAGESGEARSVPSSDSRNQKDDLR